MTEKKQDSGRVLFDAKKDMTIDYKKTIEVYGVSTSSGWGCVPMETEVLTPQGWKTYYELKEGDEVYTWKDGYLNINKIQYLIKCKNESGKLYVFSSSQVVNNEHRVLTDKDLAPADEVVGYPETYKPLLRLQGSLIEDRAEKISDLEVVLAAMCYRDGNFEYTGRLAKETNRTTIYFEYHDTSWEQNTAYIKDLFDKFGLSYIVLRLENGTHVYRFDCDSAYKLRDLIGNTRKIEPKFLNLSWEQSLLFLNTYFEDGTMIPPKNKHYVDDLQHIAIRAGYTSEFDIYGLTNNDNDGRIGMIFRRFWLKKNEAVTDVQISEIDYDGDVWFPNTEDGVVIFREEGSVFISENCQAPSSNMTLDTKKDTTIDYKKTIEDYIDIKDWRVKENSTVTYSIGGSILANSGAMTANYWLSEIYDKEIADAHRNGDIHIHDLSMLTGYCAGWSLKQLIQEGLGGVKGKVTSKPAKHLNSLCNQMVNFLGIMQNEWAGAQAFSSFDTYLAPFVKVDNLDYETVKHCIESFVYGVNTPSRWGCVPMTTEVLTPQGWKTYNDLKEGDEIYTWKDGYLNINKIQHLIKHKNESGKLYVFSSPQYSYQQIVNNEHRVLTDKGLVPAGEVAKHPKAYKLPLRLRGSLIEDRAEKISDLEVVLAGMFLGNGSFGIRGDTDPGLGFHDNSRGKNKAYIEDLFDRFGLRYTVCNDSWEQYRIYNKSKILELLARCNRNNLNWEQSLLFLNAFIENRGYGHDRYIDSLQHIAIRAGYTSSLYPANFTKEDPARPIYLREADNVTDIQVYEIDHDGDVWCPNTEDGVVIFRDGLTKSVFISGNCQAPFSNITLDWTVPEDLAEQCCIVGGKEMAFKYKDCKKEMDMINKAFIEVMLEGDADGRGFQYPIPTYSITKDFDWSDTENNRFLFELTAKYGTPYFSNYVNSDMKPSDVRSMCCRLRLDLRDLRKKVGGLFGSGESTGSVGVVTVNLPALAYKAKDEQDFYNQLDHIMDVSARSLHVKRETVTKLLEMGLYPYTKRYLGTFDNHFSTIGIVGMNEAVLNAKWLQKDLTHKEAQVFAKDVLEHMKKRLIIYQEKYNALYNLEATPAEGASYRLAKHDVERYPDIKTAGDNGETPYYTNSTHLPVSFTDDVFTALDIQDELQPIYTSGTVFHTYLGEKLPNWKAAATLVKKISDNYRLPYYTISPTYSICEDHGYIRGEEHTCPICGKPTEIWSRITGYYRPVQNWNDGKQQEFRDRKEYQIATRVDETEDKVEDKEVENKKVEPADGDKPVTVDMKGKEVLLFTTTTCPNCKIVKQLLADKDIDYKEVDAAKNFDLVEEYDVMTAPTLVITDGEHIDKLAGIVEIQKHL